MKKHLSFLYIMIIIANLMVAETAYTQNSGWEWVRVFGGKGADEIFSSCTDKNGDIYIAGYFQEEINMDGIILKSKGDNDILIAKFNNKGNLIWAKQAGGTYSENLVISEYAKRIKVDSDGNIIVAGCFMWEADFDKQMIRGPGNTDIFVAKYSSSGKLLWVNSYGSEQHDFLFDMDIDEHNNIFLTGNFTGQFKIDSLSNEFEGAEYEGPGTTPFIARLNAKGNLEWMRRDIGKADKTLIKVSKQKIYYALEYSTDLLLKDAYHSVSGNSDFIVQCMNIDGDIEWQRKFSSNHNESIESLDAGIDGSVLISGKYGNIPEYKSNFNENQESDLCTYFSKLDFDGSVSWTANNNSPPSIGGTNFSKLSEETYFSTDIYTIEVDVDGFRIVPDGEWYNSYVALLDKYGKTREILLTTPGIIKSVIPTKSHEYYVSGSILSSVNAFEQRNNNGGFIDFYIGLRKLPMTEIKNSNEQNNNFLDSKVTVFPNPASNTFTVTIDNQALIERINITNHEGKLIHNFIDCKIPFTMDIHDLASGTYYVTLVNQGIIISKKLVINN